jgi:hypothetical protein
MSSDPIPTIDGEHPIGERSEVFEIGMTQSDPLIALSG